jgi:hypothetical protein
VSRLLERRACGRARVTYVTVTPFCVLFPLHASLLLLLRAPPLPLVIANTLTFPYRPSARLPATSPPPLLSLLPPSCRARALPSVRCSRALRSLTPRPRRVYVHTRLTYTCARARAHTSSYHRRSTSLRATTVVAASAEIKIVASSVERSVTIPLDS